MPAQTNPQNHRTKQRGAHQPKPVACLAAEQEHQQSRSPGTFAPHRIAYAVSVAVCSIALSVAGPQNALAQPSPHRSADERRSFDIPAGPLAPALRSLASAANVLLTFTADQTNGKTTTGVDGQHTLQEALAALLAGTGLQAVQLDNGGYVLRAAPGAPDAATGGEVVLPAVTVRAAAKQETAEGPAKGYLAKRSATGTKTDTPIIETPQSMSVVTRDEMTSRGATTVREVLGYTPGVQVEQSVDLRDEWFQIRGFNGTQNVYRDGLRMGLSSGYSSADLNPYGLERIEVLRGPSSMIYGQAGAGGIVNMVTKRPTDTPLHEIELSAGSFDNKQAAFDLGGPLDAERQWSYRLTGLLRDSETQTDFVKNDRTYIAPALTWRPSASTSLTLLTHYQKDSQGAAVNNSLPRVGTLNPNPNGQIPVGRYPGEPGFDKFEKSQSSIGYLFEHRLNDMWTLKQNLRYSDIASDYANAYADGLGVDQRTVSRSVYAPSDTARTLRLDNQMQAQWRQGKFDHTMIFGLDYQRTRYTFKAASGTAPSIDIFAPVYGAAIAPLTLGEDSVTHAQQLGVYLQDQTKFDQRWVFVLGGRGDRSRIEKTDSINANRTQQSDSMFTGRAGIVHLFDNGWAPYASYSTSFEPVIGSDAAGNSFNPTEGKQTELGLRYQRPGSSQMFSAAIFDLTQQHVLTSDPSNPNRQIQTGEIRSRGLELEGKIAVSRSINLTASYTHLDARITRSNDGVRGNRRGGVPRNAAALWADYRVQSEELQGLSIGAGARFTGKTPVADTNVHSLPARTLLDAMLRYDWGRYTVAINGTNLLNKKYVGFCTNDDYGFCGYAPARNVVISLRHHW